MNNLKPFKERSARDKFLLINTAILFTSGVTLHLITINSMESFLNNSILISNIAFFILLFVNYFYTSLGKFLTITKFIVIIAVINSNYAIGIDLAYLYIYFLIFVLYSFRKDKKLIFFFFTITFFAWVTSTYMRLSANSSFPNSINLITEDQLALYRISFTIVILLNIFTIVLLFIIANSRFENKLDNKLNKATKHNDIKTSFLNSFTKKIEIPLNKIIDLSFKIKNNSTEQNQIIKLDSLITASKGLNTLVNNILEYTNKFDEIRFVETDLHQILENKKELYGFMASEKKSEFIIELPDNFPLIKLDKFKYEIVLNNLISNAIKFTENGEIKVKITFTEIINNKISFITEVIDTGIGISKSKLSKVFEEFSQENDSIIENYGGSGLGLFIVKNIVKEMDSDIHLESEKGIGSRFYFQLTADKL
jgi:signal transduction histidine kinase